MCMSKTKRIETKRLFLIPFTDTHLTERYVGWLNDGALLQYSEHGFTKHTILSCKEFMKSFANSPNYFWATHVKGEESEISHIGNMTAYVNPHHKCADIGIMIGEKNAWGKGYGREEWLAVCDYLLRHEGLRKVTASTLSVNIAMQKVMNSIGMRLEGVQQQQCIVKGEEVDKIYMSLFREEWLKDNPKSHFKLI